MTIGRIALGVFLGNLAFALVAWFALGVLTDSRTAAANARIERERLEIMQSHDKPAASNGL